MGKKPSLKPLITELYDRKKMDFLTREFLDQLKIGNVIVENIKELDIGELSVTNVELKLPCLGLDVKEWGISTLQRPLLMSGFSKVHPRLFLYFWICLKKALNP